MNKNAAKLAYNFLTSPHRFTSVGQGSVDTSSENAFKESMVVAIVENLAAKGEKVKIIKDKFKGEKELFSKVFPQAPASHQKYAAQIKTRNFEGGTTTDGQKAMVMVSDIYLFATDRKISSTFINFHSRQDTADRKLLRNKDTVVLDLLQEEFGIRLTKRDLSKPQVMLQKIEQVHGTNSKDKIEEVKTKYLPISVVIREKQVSRKDRQINISLNRTHPNFKPFGSIEVFDAFYTTLAQISTRNLSAKSLIDESGVNEKTLGMVKNLLSKKFFKFSDGIKKAADIDGVVKAFSTGGKHQLKAIDGLLKGNFSITNARNTYQKTVRFVLLSAGINIMGKLDMGERLGIDIEGYENDLRDYDSIKSKAAVKGHGQGNTKNAQRRRNKGAAGEESKRPPAKGFLDKWFGGSDKEERRPSSELPSGSIRTGRAVEGRDSPSLP